MAVSSTCQRDTELVPMSIVSAGEEAAWTTSPLSLEYTQEAAYQRKENVREQRALVREKGQLG